MLNPEISDAVYNMYRNIGYLRQREGLTLAQMAEIIGISEQTLADAEKCMRLECFYDVHIKNICTHFKVSADALLHDKLY